MSTDITIRRDVNGVAGRTVDLVVVGGGIYGILIALESSARGLSTLLLEKGDFGSGASFNSLRTIHGGLRYLQRLDLPRARSSGRLRHWWLSTFPEFVEPIDCLMPLYGEGLKRPPFFRAAFALLKLIGADSSAGLLPERVLNRPGVVSDGHLRTMISVPLRKGVRGAAMWSDAFMPASQRVVMEALRWAVSAGAEAINYAEVIAVEAGDQRVSRLAVHDHATGASIRVMARSVVNATGGDANLLLKKLIGLEKPILHPTIAWNLWLDFPPVSRCSLAVAAPGPKARVYFLHPFHGGVLAGTGHESVSPGQSSLKPTARMINGMLADLGAGLPGSGIDQARIRRVFSGVLPGRVPGRADLALRPRIIRHPSGTGGGQLWSVIGVKFTEAPLVARRVLDRLVGRRRRPLPPRPDPETAWRISARSGQLDRKALLNLARAESAIYLEDMLERRTDAWCREADKIRLAGLLGEELPHLPRCR